MSVSLSDNKFTLRKLSLLLIICLFLLSSGSFAAERATIDRLLQFAKTRPNSTEFLVALRQTLGEENIQKGAAIAGHGPDHFWAVEATSRPDLYVDDQQVGTMRQIGNSKVWFYNGPLSVGTSHRFHYKIKGAVFGGSNDIPAYTPDSYAKSGVPIGRLSEKIIHTSKIYPGMKSNYWIYVPAQYDPSTPAALMVWQDGERYNARNTEEVCRLCPSLYRLQEVTDNLIHQKKIPVMIHVFISPGEVEGKSMRSIQYDTVSDTYANFLLNEILPEVHSKYNIRKDAYSRAIQGQSSGGICAFNVAWRRPDQFSRVYTVVGSYVALQWRPGELDGGNIIPFVVRREPKKNLRVWLNDGSEDQETRPGSWPLQNIQLANSLKMRGYDFFFSYGAGTHHAAQAASELPKTLTWLWRDYDPAKTEQTFEQDAEEKAKPLFRVRIYNR
jgi:enterochelin esterase family protein